jgi:hypothetical protein
MAELITGVIALPVLYLIGEFYWRGGRDLLRTLRPAVTGRIEAAEAEPLPDSSRYDAALATASAVLGELTARPEMSQAEKLSTVTYTILRAMGEREQPCLPAREGP